LIGSYLIGHSIGLMPLRSTLKLAISIGVLLAVRCLMSVRNRIPPSGTVHRQNSPSHVHICLIHNQEADRLSHLVPRLKALPAALPDWTFIFTEISEQPPIRPHTFITSYARTVIYWILGQRWARYRLMPGDCWPLPVFSYSGAVKYAFASAVEVAVTAKHIAAWSRFLGSGDDYLIVMESDAVFLPDSAARLDSLLHIVSRLSGLLYADLAGGLSRDVLGIEKLIDHDRGGLTHFIKPVTNTACAYLLNRVSVNSFSDSLHRLPYLRWVGIDWMMNAIMMDHETRGVLVAGMHANPPIFQHGSVCGQYSSTIPRPAQS